MNKIKSIILFVLLGILFLSVCSCCIGQNKEVKMEIVQKVTLDANSLISTGFDKNYRVETCLIARWKKCYTWSSITHYKHLRILTDWVKCEDIAETKKDQMEIIVRLKNSVEECIKINPNIIINY